MNLGTQQGRAYRHAAAHRLGHAHHVGLQIKMIAGKEFTGATKAGLNFIDNQQNTAFGTELACRCQVLGLDWIDPAFALHQFEHDRSRVVSYGRIEFFDLVEGHIVEPRNQGLESFAIFGCVSGADSAHSAAMEATHRGDKVGAPGVQSSEFKCGFNRFRARITQVSSGQTLRGYLDQLFEQV